MNNSFELYSWIAGVLTGVTVTLVSAYSLWSGPYFWEAIFWQALLLPCLIIVSSPDGNQLSHRVRIVALWTFLVLIFVISWRVPFDIFFIYTIVWVAISAHYLPKTGSWICLILITIAWLLVRAYIWKEEHFFIETVLVTTFHIFALMSSLSALEASKANDKTQQLNRELLATQHLLGEASRESERTRIARDLHDLVGHHLTALTINLQVASHKTDGEAKQTIEQCYALSKLLLADVRDAVSALKSLPVVDLKELLQIATCDIPRLSVELDFQQSIQIDDVKVGEALLRMVQECVTNTLKHTQSTQARIGVHEKEGNVILNYSDGGRISEPIEFGNGLAGMRERFDNVGGSLDVTTTPSFSITAVAPLKSVV